MRKAPRAATARTTRTERVPYRKSRSRRLDTGSGGLLSVIRLRGAPLSRREHVPERPDQLRELEREDELRRRAGPERLERVEVLQHQRLLIDALRRSENGGQRLRVTFCAEDGGLPAPLGPQDRGLLVSFRDGDRRRLPAVGFDDDGPSAPLGGHLEDHGVRDVLGREDLSDLDVRDLNAPPGRDLVQLRAEDRVDLLPLREDLVQDDVADDGPQRRRGDPHGGALEVVHADDGIGRARDLEVHDEVDIDGRIVLRDAGLVGDRQVSLPQIHPSRLVDARDHGDDARPLLGLCLAESKVDDSFVLLDHFQGGEKEDQDDDDEDERSNKNPAQLHALKRRHRTQVEWNQESPHAVTPGAGMNAPRLKTMAGLPWIPCAGIETAGPVEQVRSERCPPRIARRPCFVGPRKRSHGGTRLPGPIRLGRQEGLCGDPRMRGVPWTPSCGLRGNEASLGWSSGCRSVISSRWVARGLSITAGCRQSFGLEERSQRSWLRRWSTSSCSPTASDDGAEASNRPTSIHVAPASSRPRG